MNAITQSITLLRLFLIIGVLKCSVFLYAQDLEEKDDPKQKFLFELSQIKSNKTDSNYFEKLLIARENIQKIQEKQSSSIIRDNEYLTNSILEWEEQGPKNVGGRCRSIVTNKLPNGKITAWAGSVRGGLWYYPDINDKNGKWEKISEIFDNISVTTIALNPVSKNTISFGTGEGWFNIDAQRGDGIYTTTDDGQTWKKVTPSKKTEYKSPGMEKDFYYVQKLVYDNQGNLFAGTNSGVLQLPKNSKTWIKIYNTYVTDMEFDGGNILYFATYGQILKYLIATSEIINISNDILAESNGRFELTCTKVNSKICYLLTENVGRDAENNNLHTINNIYKSTTEGRSWEICSLPVDIDTTIGSDISRGQAWYDLTIEVDPLNPENVFVGGVNLFYSTNGGNDWTQLSHWNGEYGLQKVHADQHTVNFIDGVGNIILFGNDGGIFITENPPEKKSDIFPFNKGLNITQLYSLSIHPALSNSEFICGAQDNGTYMVSGNNQTELMSGDGGYCFINQNNPNEQIMSYTRNTYYVTKDRWFTYKLLERKKSGLFINPCDLDSKNEILYSYGKKSIYIWKSIFDNSSIGEIKLNLNNDEDVSYIKVSPNVSNQIYVGTTKGKLLKIISANTRTAQIKEIGLSFPNYNISCIDVEKNLEDHILVTFSNYGAKSIMESFNSQKEFPVWTNIFGNLQDIPIRCGLILKDGFSNKLIIGSELGIWSTLKSKGSQTSWITNNTGLDNVRVDMLKYKEADKTLWIATHGRGVFKASMDEKLNKENALEKLGLYYLKDSLKVINNPYNNFLKIFTSSEGYTLEIRNTDKSNILKILKLDKNNSIINLLDYLKSDSNNKFQIKIKKNNKTIIDKAIFKSEQ